MRIVKKAFDWTLTSFLLDVLVCCKARDYSERATERRREEFVNIIAPPEDTSVCKGSNVTISCGYDSPTALSTAWLINKTVFNPEDLWNSPMYHLNNPFRPRIYSLTVFSINGTTTFQCSVVSNHTIISLSGTVAVTDKQVIEIAARGGYRYVYVSWSVPGSVTNGVCKIVNFEVTVSFMNTFNKVVNVSERSHNFTGLPDNTTFNVTVLGFNMMLKRIGLNFTSVRTMSVDNIDDSNDDSSDSDDGTDDNAVDNNDSGGDNNEDDDDNDGNGNSSNDNGGGGDDNSDGNRDSDDNDSSDNDSSDGNNGGDDDSNDGSNDDNDRKSDDSNNSNGNNGGDDANNDGINGSNNKGGNDIDGNIDSVSDDDDGGGGGSVGAIAGGVIGGIVIVIIIFITLIGIYFLCKKKKGSIYDDTMNLKSPTTIDHSHASRGEGITNIQYDNVVYATPAQTVAIPHQTSASGEQYAVSTKAANKTNEKQPANKQYDDVNGIRMNTQGITYADLQELPTDVSPTFKDAAVTYSQIT